MVNLCRLLAVPAAAAALTAAFIAADPHSASAAVARPAGVQPCNSNTKTWVDVYSNIQDWEKGYSGDFCIGDKGDWDLPSNDEEILCAGNNNGVITYADAHENQALEQHTFWSDTSYVVSNGKYEELDWDNPPAARDYIQINDIKITGWTGSAGC